MVNIVLGEMDRAFELLEKALEARGWQMALLIPVTSSFVRWLQQANSKPRRHVSLSHYRQAPLCSPSELGLLEILQ
jgi:hypothetical protein